MIRSTARDAGARDSGSNPGMQWLRDCPIDVPATPAPPDVNLRNHETLDSRTRRQA